MTGNRLQQFKREYTAGELREEDINRDPHLQFLAWLDDAIGAGIMDPTAMALATADATGMPSVRMVLLKEVRETGLVFFSNYESRKGKELLHNPRASVVFYWPVLERQLRVEGIVEKLPEEESDTFFHSRPPESRYAAVVSRQSNDIPGRDVLLKDFEKIRLTEKDSVLQRPAYWGGYILKPVSYEFWQGREHRLNDRLAYYQDDEGWKIRRLAP